MISSNENQTHTQWLIDESSNNFGESFLDNINANEDLQKSTKIQTLEEYSKSKNLPLTINQRGGNFPHNSILLDNADNEQFLDTAPQNIFSSIHDTYLKNIGTFID